MILEVRIFSRHKASNLIFGKVSGIGIAIRESSLLLAILSTLT